MSPRYLDESTVVLSLKEGDIEAFNYIYKKYHASLYHYALNIVKIPSLAEDIVQEVFLKIWEVRNNIKPQLCFQAYLYKISRNLIFKAIRNIANDKRLIDKVVAEIREIQEEDATSILQWQHYSEWLKEAIDNLPPQRKRVFKLCREQGKTYQQAAQELGISKLTVKEHMTLAVKSMKQYLYQHGDISLIFFIVLFLA
jgi:RNA polymerase sigma-70 factor (ECF subfamily)